MKELLREKDFSLVYVPYQDVAMRQRVKSLGGTWLPDKKAWRVTASAADILFSRMLNLGSLPTDTARASVDVDSILKGYEFRNPKPYDHQMMTLASCLKHGRFGLFLEMGLGKTRIMCDTIQILKDREKVKVLVLTVKSMISVWSDEIMMWTKNVLPIKVTGTAKEKQVALMSGADVFISNYETVLGELKYPSFDMIVLDESQRIKAHDAKRTKRLIGKDRLFAEARYRFILTGTPISQSPLDIYTQFRFLDRNFLPFSSYYAFRNRYAKMGGYMGYQVIGYDHIQELEGHMKSHSMTLTKKDCLDLPDKIFKKRVLEMPKELLEQYDHMKKELIIEFEGEKVTASIALVKLLRLSEITSGIFIEDKYNLKLQEVIDIVDDYGANGIVIWVRFIKTLKKLEAMLVGKGKRVGVLYGETSGDDRMNTMKAFQEGKLDVFIGQITAGGLGITLTRASYVVYYENTFSLIDRKQSEDRTHRIGMRNPCVYIDLVYEKSIDLHVLKAIEKKEDMATSIINNIKTILEE